MFKVKDLTFTYDLNGQRLEILKNLNFTVEPGEFVAIQGPSGSGKSTLFYILGFMLKPTAGTVLFDNLDINTMSTDALTLVRNKKIGFVFQQFHLLNRATVLENILLPARYPSETASVKRGDIDRAKALAQKLGLGEHLNHLPNQLSGGQQQRVAIARALMNDVDIILADEPTGNLDSRTSEQILDLLLALNREGKTIIIITHDPVVAKRCQKIYHLLDGQLVKTEEREAFNGPHPGVGKSIELKEVSKVLTPNAAVQLLRSLWPMALDNLRRNRAKSVLTMLGVIIGIAAVLSMITLGQFTKQKILDSYETLGVNKVIIRGYENWRLKATESTGVNFHEFDWVRDVTPMKRIFPEIKMLSPWLNHWGLRAIAGGIEAGDNKVNAYGVTPEYLNITSRQVLYGRNMSQYNVEQRSPVCLLGYDLASALFSRIDPLGQIISLTDGSQTNFPCEVIGVLASIKSNKDNDPPNLNVLLPYTYFQTAMTQSWYSELHSLVVQVQPDVDIETTGQKLKSFLKLKYGKSGSFSVDSDSTLIAEMKKFLNVFAVLLASIALLSLIVGGIGINNMMLVSIAERIKEFGLRKALGATNSSLRYQILLESTVLCSVAGILGLLLGFSAYEALIYGATKFVPHLQFEWVFDPFAALLSVTAIVAVGVFSGLVPAIRAERLQVIEALRME